MIDSYRCKHSQNICFTQNCVHCYSENITVGFVQKLKYLNIYTVLLIIY